MNAQQIRDAYKKAIKLEPIDVYIQIEGVQKLIKEILLYHSSLKYEKTRTKYRNYAIQLSQLLTGLDDTPVKGAFRKNKQETLGPNYTLLHSADFIEVEPDGIRPDYGDYSEENSENVNDINESTLPFGPTNNYEPESYVETNPASGIPYLYDPENLIQKLQSELELKCDKDGELINELISIARDHYNLYDISDAYHSGYWRDEEKKWKNLKLRAEINFLHKIDRYLDLEIETLGEFLPWIIIRHEIWNLGVYNERTSYLDPEKFFMLCLDIPHVSIQGENIKTSLDAFKQFIDPSNIHLSQYEALTVIFHTGSGALLSRDMQNLSIETEEEKFQEASQRLYELIKNMAHFNDEKMEIVGFTYHN